MYRYHYYFPHVFTGIRVILCILFLFTYISDFIGLAIFIFSIAVLTDIIDGKLARKLEVCTQFGFYFDVIADFLLVVFSFTAFFIKKIYPFWFLLLIGFMFFQFLITSKIKKPIYDPVGKYLFLALIIITYITFISVEIVVVLINCFVFLGFSVISLYSRYKSLKKNLNNENCYPKNTTQFSGNL